MLDGSIVNIEAFNLGAVSNPEDILRRLLIFLQVQINTLDHLDVTYHAVSVSEGVNLCHRIRLLVLGDGAEAYFASFNFLLHLIHEFFRFLHVELIAVEIVREA